MHVGHDDPWQQNTNDKGTEIRTICCIGECAVLVHLYLHKLALLGKNDY